MVPLRCERPTWWAVAVLVHWTRVVRARSWAEVSSEGSGDGDWDGDDGEPVRPRRVISVQRMGRLRPTEEMPPQALKKLPSPLEDWSGDWPLAGLRGTVGAQWPGTCEGRSFRSGVQGLWSETTVLITPSLAWSRSSDQSLSWFDWLRMGGQHLWRVSPSRTCSAARER